MSKLPNYVEPYPDEFLYSWINRLAAVNALTLKEFSHAYCGMRAGWPVSPGITHEFLPLCRSLETSENIDELFLSLTTMSFEMAPRMPLSQVRYFNSAFQPKSALNPSIKSLVPFVRICPKCVKEDIKLYGQPYIHRSHQLSGSCVCWKHHTKLMEYHGRKGHEMDFDMNGYEECDVPVSIEDEAAYAQYSQTLLEENIQTDALSVKDAILKRMEEKGFDTSDLVSSFLPSFQEWDHSGLIARHDYELFLKRTLHQTKCYVFNMSMLVPILMYLWPDPHDFADAVSDHEPYLMQYTCPTCGHRYYETPESQRAGWGCPYCAEKMTDEDRFEHLVDVMGNGEYEVLTPFKSLEEKVTMQHVVCGREFEIWPSFFLFNGRGCPCTNHNDSEQRARKLVESLPGGFKLLEYNGYHKPATFLCEKCGRTFQYNYIDFKVSQHCRYCDYDPKTLKEFTERVKDLVGNEYMVVRKDPDDSDKIIMKHKKCGHEFSVSMHAFLAGVRCPHCKYLKYPDELPELLDEYSKGRYTVIKHFDTHGKYQIYDAMTGQTFKMSSRMILQEIKRPTPSAKLPLDPAWNDVDWIPVWEKKRQEVIQRLSEIRLENFLFDMDDELAKWLRRQLFKWTCGDLLDERISLLIEIDPHMKDFIPFDRDWDEQKWKHGFELYQRLLNEKSKIKRRTMPEKRSIESWKYSQRKKYFDGQLSAYHRDKLLAIDPHFFDKHKTRKEHKS